MTANSRGFVAALIGDGRPLISLTGICLGLSGAFALFQSATGHFLPQDTAFLQMSASDLCRINECRIVHFMIHDRVSFGGALIAIAVVYLWMAAFPLQAAQRWAWWALLASGVAGFGSFLSYLGYGYLDHWHAVAMVALAPCFFTGVWLTRPRPLIRCAERRAGTIRAPGFRPTWLVSWRTRAAVGRGCLLGAATGMIAAGFTILVVGMTEVFVPSDLTFMGLTRAEVNAINPRLIPLIAHDRAGFGGAVATAGMLLLASSWWGDNSRSLWQAMLIGGVAGWGAAIGIHPIVGYNDARHLAPAVAGAALYFTGLFFTRSAMMGSECPPVPLPLAAAGNALATHSDGAHRQ